MQRWEYCTVESGDANAIIRFCATRQVAQTNNVDEALAWLGHEGWELVAVTNVVSSVQYTLKRPLSK